MKGQRTNTREMRTRKKLEETLQNSIQELQTLCPSYVPPADCRQTAKYTAKVYIPSEKYPHINFVGLCIGPRGYTLKEMEEESGAKIIIRGRGSVKEGKLGGQEMMLPGSDEPLHAYITANHHDSIAKAQTRINRIIEEAVDSPEGENTLRSKQMNQLAVLNGTVSTNNDMLS
ncbi:MAG: Splicing factor 1, partial [Paramarteilia canceri]